jgi:DNA-binding GntR family transcriptional regulator
MVVDISEVFMLKADSMRDPSLLEGEDGVPAFGKLSSSVLREQAYEALANALRSGRYAPGAAVTIRGLAEQLGTSTMPVREAVNRLLTEGALEMLANRTLGVPMVTVQRLDDLIEARATVEARAASLAAERMDTAAFSRIKRAAEAYSHAVDSELIAEAVVANEQLHFEIYRASGSDALLSIIERLWLQSGPYIAAVMKHMHTAAHSLHERGIAHHYNILAALAKRDAEAVGAAMRADIIDAARWYKEQIFAEDGSLLEPIKVTRKPRGRRPASA